MDMWETYMYYSFFFAFLLLLQWWIDGLEGEIDTNGIEWGGWMGGWIGGRIWIGKHVNTKKHVGLVSGEGIVEYM